MTVSGTELQPTPTENVDLPTRVADFGTLAEGLDYAAQGEAGFNFYSPRGKLEHVVPFRDLRDEALKAGRGLIKAGLARGSRVVIVADTSPDFMNVFFGCQYAGLVPCPVPYSMYIGGRDAYVERIAGMMLSARASAVVMSTDMEAQISEAAEQAGVKKVLTHEKVRELGSANVDLTPFGPDDVAYIQYSSGSTSNPKGVLVTQRSVMANAYGILAHGMGLRPGDRAASWLPLYHDMGLVGFCLAPMLGQRTIDYLATTAFARRPVLWLKIISDNRCTITFSPSFGFDLAARRVNGSAGDYDLSCVRIAGIGGDMVRPDILNYFAEKMAPAGFDPKAFLPSYGMAESTLAVTFADRDALIRVDEIDSAHSKLQRRAVPADVELQGHSDRVRQFVACGKPMPGHEIEVRADDGKVLGEREIGHIMIKGPSLMAGYFENDEATDEVMREDGWLATGDMGYLLDGEIVITGRSKDLILHNGRNIWPQDIEWAAERVEPLRSGDVAAVALENNADNDDVLVMVQCRSNDEEQQEELRRKVAAVVHQMAGVECRVALVPPKSLPFTSSGKLSRAGAKARYLSGEIREIAEPFVQALTGSAGPQAARAAE